MEELVNNVKCQLRKYEILLGLKDFGHHFMVPIWEEIRMIWDRVEKV